MRRFYCKREILEKYISSLCNKPKASSMNKSLEQLIWNQNSNQKKKKINFEKKNYDDDEEK